MPDTQMPENIDKNDPNAERKQTKQLVEAYTKVLEHRLGHPPTMQELSEFLSEEPDQSPQVEPLHKPVDPNVEPQADESPAPKIMGYKVYFGMRTVPGQDGQEERKPDPDSVLFYEDPTSGRVYDVDAQEWLETKPPLMEHLSSRPILFDAKRTDLLRAIYNGVVDDGDYQALEKAGILSGKDPAAQPCIRVWQLHKRANEQLQHIAELEKSIPTEPVGEVGAPLEPQADLAAVPAGENVVANFMNTAGASAVKDVLEDAGVQAGEDLVAQIIQAAFANVGIEEVVRAEVEKQMTQVVAILEREFAGNAPIEFEAQPEVSTIEPQVDAPATSVRETLLS